MNKYYKAKIIEVLPGSIAHQHHIEPGGSLLAIDNNSLRDLLDYQFAIYDTEEIELLLEKPDGSLKTIKIEKEADEDPGLIFESGVFDKVKICNNKCIFCFVDQQPEGLRDTLYIKDDDYRLSYLQGTYITLTNMTKADKKRLEQLRIGPLYVSVHTTNPELRIKMLNNKLAGDIKDKLKWLEELFIPVHAQIVVCPGFNDGEELKNTLKDLAKYENVLSVAIVPVGITKFRKDNKLKPFDKQIALETIEIANKINKNKDDYFALPSDEIYMLAQKPIPPESFYGDFMQLDDGVGSARLILDQFNSMQIPEKIETPLNIGIITASLAAQILKPAFEKLNDIDSLNLSIIEIDNKYWGNKISVCGLVVAQDIILKLESMDYIPENIFLPSVMLRQFSNEFLDGIKVKDIEKKFNIKIHILQNYYSFEELVSFIISSP